MSYVPKVTYFWYPRLKARVTSAKELVKLSDKIPSGLLILSRRPDFPSFAFF